MNIAVYISGHGFGHLAQTAPVLNSLFRRRPECRFLVRCSLPEKELQARFDFDFELEAELVDLGVVQKSAIEEDRESSIKLMSQWTANMDDFISREISLLKAFAPDLVLSNISPLAFPAAKALAVPAIALATLDWYTIYSYWLRADDPVLIKLKRAYEACDLLISPPMAMQMNVFPNRLPIPLITDKAAEVGFTPKPGWKKQALVIFGGSKQPAFDIQALAKMSDWLFLIPGAPESRPDNVQSVVFDKTLKPVDLMPYVDVVVCKPGYGILAECWQTETPIAWVERLDFPEFPMLKEWLDNTLPSAGMTREAFKVGDWLPTLEGAVNCSREFPKLECDGADKAAEVLLSFCEGNRLNH